MHYRNQRPAHVGDAVIGKVYNTPGVIVGQMVAITPGSTTCNCTVALIGNAAQPVKTDYSQCDYLYLADDAYDAIEALRQPPAATPVVDTGTQTATGTA